MPLFLVSAAALLTVAGRVQANGRYPLADQLVAASSDPAHLVVRTTFGLLDSADGGKSFTWTCEKAIGYFGAEDPPIALTGRGTTLVASSRGISVSTDHGCSWRQNPGLAGTWYGVDVTALPHAPASAIALMSTYRDGAYTSSVLQTVDDGASWQQVGRELPLDFVATTLEVAGPNSEIVYVSGRDTIRQEASVLRSDDAGLTWIQSYLGIKGSFALFIGAVDPNDPNVVYVRAEIAGQGHVLVSRDGAATFEPIYQQEGGVLGLALSGDGTTLAVGAPGAGVHVASTSTFAFEKASPLGAYCLAWVGADLLMCGKEALDSFSIAVSHDRGATFTPILHLSDVAPRACEAGSTAQTTCGEFWGAVALSIGADAGTSTDASALRGPTLVADGGPKSGCGCSLAARDRFALAELAWPLALVLAKRRRIRSDPGNGRPTTQAERRA